MTFDELRQIIAAEIPQAWGSWHLHNVMERGEPVRWHLCLDLISLRSQLTADTAEDMLVAWRKMKGRLA